jgi:hypothetical protein
LQRSIALLLQNVKPAEGCVAIGIDVTNVTVRE